MGTNKYQKVRSTILLGLIPGKYERTIRRELQHGMVLHELGDVPFERWDYNTKYAQNDAERKSLGKGLVLKLGKDWAFVEQVSHLLKDRRYSPYAVIQYCQNTGWPRLTRICEKTLYRSIAAGDITDVSEKILLLQGRRRKPHKKPA